MRSVRIPGAGRDAERARAFARESGVNDVRHGPTLATWVVSDAKSRTSVPPRAASPVRTMSLQERPVSVFRRLVLSTSCLRTTALIGSSKYAHHRAGAVGHAHVARRSTTLTRRSTRRRPDAQDTSIWRGGVTPHGNRVRCTMGTLMRAASTRLMNEPPGGSIRARSATVSVYLCSYLSRCRVGPVARLHSRGVIYLLCPCA